VSNDDLFAYQGRQGSSGTPPLNELAECSAHYILCFGPAPGKPSIIESSSAATIVPSLSLTFPTPVLHSMAFESSSSEDDEDAAFGPAADCSESSPSLLSANFVPSRSRAAPVPAPASYLPPVLQDVVHVRRERTRSVSATLWRGLKAISTRKRVRAGSDPVAGEAILEDMTAPRDLPPLEVFITHSSVEAM
jgi:hypothetical protein